MDEAPKMARVVIKEIEAASAVVSLWQRFDLMRCHFFGLFLFGIEYMPKY
jgi:hypothetical protein